MNTVQKVVGHERFRMADFAQWGAALADGLGYSKEEFFIKYRESVDHKWKDSVEENTLAQRILDFLRSKGGEWHGSSVELLAQIKTNNNYDKAIPNHARLLSQELVRIAPMMRRIGVGIIRQEKREAGTGRRLFVITEIPRSCEQGVKSCEDCE